MKISFSHAGMYWALSALMFLALPLLGQDIEVKRITAAVSYITVGSVYLNAGKDRGLAVGDTLNVTRGSNTQGRVVVTAISSSSTVAQILMQAGPFAIGDSAAVVKRVPVTPPAPQTSGSMNGSRTAARPLPGDGINIVTGRVALQYAGAAPVDGPTTFSQPSALLQLGVGNLLGTGMTFSMYGRSYYDLSDHFELYGQGSRLKLRMYEFSLSSENAQSWYGFGVGRLTSRFVGGLGQIDGGQFYLRKGNISAGVLLGLQPDYTTSGVNTDYQKMAGFVNLKWGGSGFGGNDITLAYGQQLFHGKLDRDFVYAQSSIRIGSRFFLYQSAEFDLHKLTDTVRTGTFRISNTFVTLSYLPLEWLSTSAGYDASRNIYLFESMRFIPPALLDRTLQQGLRGSVTARLPLNIALTGSANVRVRKGEDHDARTLGTGIRMSDVAGTDFNAGFQYLDIRGLYTEGKDIIVDLDRWISPSFSVSLRLDRYAYTLLYSDASEVSTTASANVNLRVSQAVYGLVSFDHVWDLGVRTMRIYTEIGLRF